MRGSWMVMRSWIVTRGQDIVVMSPDLATRDQEMMLDIYIVTFLQPLFTPLLYDTSYEVYRNLIFPVRAPLSEPPTLIFIVLA